MGFFWFLLTAPPGGIFQSENSIRKVANGLHWIIILLGLLLGGGVLRGFLRRREHILCSSAFFEELAADIAHAIEADNFYLVFQPIVEIHSNQIIGAEVLSRLKHPRYGVVKPDQFLEALSRAGLQDRFDYYIFEKTCAWFAKNYGMGKKLKFLSCNFCRQTLSAEDFADRITRIANRYAIPPGCMAIEITEQKQEKDTEQVRRNLEQLQKRGFQVFLDDFGSGVTSLWDFQHYRVDMVKIDRSMLNQTENKRGAAIFRGLVAIAEELDARVLCEGVETCLEHSFAQSSGCHYGQGYYFYSPMSAVDFGRML